MRATEIRVLLILLLAVGLAIGGTHWAHEPTLGAGAAWLRAAAMLAAAGVCVGLGILAIHRETQKQRGITLQQVRAHVLAEPGASVLVDDPQARPLVASLRDHVESLRSRVEQLQLQKKTLEIQLRLADAQRRQSEAVLAGISDAVLVTNPFGELMLANPAAAELFGFDLTGAERRPVADLLALPKLAADIADMRQSHTRAGHRAMEHTLDRNGRQRCFAVTLSCVADSAGELSGVVTVLHETTHDREVAQMKSEFVSHVSHELRTPLSSIKAYAELLVDGEAADEKQREEFYRVIQSEADRLSRLIDNILNISRIEAGITRVNRKPMSLTAVLKEALEVALPNAKNKQIELIDAVVPAFSQVHADRDMLYQAVLNLLSNAIKYTPAGGSVKVATQVDEASGHVTVLVSDTGVGIPAEAMKHLFEKFFRVEQNKSMAKGTGLGLNLTRQIIETVHGGKMLVRSEVGKGSTFGFTLPILP